MTTIAAIFKPICSKEHGCENLDERISFFEVDMKEDILAQIKRDFVRNTGNFVGEYGRNYILKGYALVEAGKSFLIKTID